MKVELEGQELQKIVFVSSFWTCTVLISGIVIGFFVSNYRDRNPEPQIIKPDITIPPTVVKIPEIIIPKPDPVVVNVPSIKIPDIIVPEAKIQVFREPIPEFRATVVEPPISEPEPEKQIEKPKKKLIRNLKNPSKTTK